MRVVVIGGTRSPEHVTKADAEAVRDEAKPGKEAGSGCLILDWCVAC